MANAGLNLFGACIRWMFLFRRKSFMEVYYENGANNGIGILFLPVFIMLITYFFY